MVAAETNEQAAGTEQSRPLQELGQAVVAEGRIRIRNAALKVGEMGYALRDELLAAKGVLDVQVNKRIGSMLVLYDKARISAESILQRVATALHVDLDKVRAGLSNINRKLVSREGRRYVKAGMGASLGIAMGALAVSGRWHILAGTVFLGCLGAHLYQNRRTLTR